MRCAGMSRTRSGELYCIAPDPGSTRTAWYSSPSPTEQTASVNESKDAQCSTRVTRPPFQPAGITSTAPGVSALTRATNDVSSS